MNPPSHHLRSRLALSVLAAAFVLTGVAQGAAVLSDVFPPSRRQASMELAARLSATREPPKLSPKLVSPFNPPSFDAPDPEEMRLQAEAAEAARRAGLAAIKPTNDRELLVALAAQIKPTGMVNLGGEPILLVGRQKLRVGDPLNASHGDKNFTVIVTSIDRTSFTLRLNGEEFTRPIKSGN